MKKHHRYFLIGAILFLIFASFFYVFLFHNASVADVPLSSISGELFLSDFFGIAALCFLLLVALFLFLGLRELDKKNDKEFDEELDREFGPEKKDERKRQLDEEWGPRKNY